MGTGKTPTSHPEYKRDLRQAEIKLQQLHFGQQSTKHLRGATAQKAEPSLEDYRVWQFYADIINTGNSSITKPAINEKQTEQLKKP